MKDIRTGPIGNISDFQRCLSIQQKTWRFDDLDIVPLHVLVTAAHTGGLVLGAWIRRTSERRTSERRTSERRTSERRTSERRTSERDKLVGFVFGLAGRDEEGMPYHHSHMAAVLPAYRGMGIGYALKQEQMRRVARQGLPLIVWTYDPLEARNAYFNLNRLGAVARTYRVNHYGILGDGLNAELESDRFKVELWLDSKRVKAQMSGQPEEPAPTHCEAVLSPADWHNDLPRPPGDGEAIAMPQTLIEIPANFQQIKQRDIGLARAWRHYFRYICQNAFANGFAAVSLERRPAPNGSAFPYRTFYLFRPLPPGPAS